MQVPAFVAVAEDWLESLLSLLGGGEPLAKVIRAGTQQMSSANITPVTEAIAVVLGSASGMAAVDNAGTGV